MRKDKKQWFEGLATKAETEDSKGNMKESMISPINSAKVRHHMLNL